MFITIEGIEGSGKSTFVKGLAEKFSEEKKEVCITREPGGSKLGLTLRPLLVSTLEEKLSARAEVLLFLADRAEHLDKVILPALKDNKIVLCDRYIHSTLAYQGYARGFDLDLLNSFNDFSSHSLMPSLTFLLDLDVETGLERAKSRNSETKAAIGKDEGKFEAEAKEFHQKVRNGFLEMALEAKKNSEHRMIVLDANLSPKELIEKAWVYIKKNF